MKLIRMIFWIVVVVVGFVVLLSSYLYFNQDRMVFVPMKDLEITPDQIGLEFEEVRIEVDEDVTLHGWYFPSSDSGKTVLFCHGNAGNISHRLETVRFLLAQKVSVLLVDYRGYGLSTGTPSEEGLYADMESGYSWLISNKGVVPEDIVLFGRSLGGAVAVELATRLKCSGLIVESSFTSVAAMGQRMFPFVPVRFFLRYEFDSVEKIGNVTVPVIVSHSPDDDIVPYSMGQKLYERATDPKEFVELHGKHNELAYLEDPEYVRVLRDLLGTPEPE